MSEEERSEDLLDEPAVATSPGASAPVQATPQMLKAAKATLKELLGKMGFEATVEAFDQGNEEVLLHIESPDAGRLIGRGAQVLDAIQYVLNRILYKQDRSALHCVVDIERYRERKKDRLLKEAFEAADRVERRGRPVKLSPMRAGDRRIIHQALKDREGIETHSEETKEPGRKRVVVCRTEAPAESDELAEDAGGAEDES